MEAAVAVAERPAAAGEAEAERDAAEQGERSEPRERHAREAGRYRDERADERRRQTERNSEPAEAPKPVFRALDPGGRHVEPAAVPLDQGATAVEAERPAAETADRVGQHTRGRHRHVGPCGSVD